MEISEIQQRQNSVRRLTDGELGPLDPEEKLGGSIAFWLSEIALQLAVSNARKRTVAQVVTDDAMDQLRAGFNFERHGVPCDKLDLEHFRTGLALLEAMYKAQG